MEKTKFTLRFKAIILIVILAAAIAAVTLSVSSYVYSDWVDRTYNSLADRLVETISLSVDKAAVEKYAKAVLEIYQQNPMSENLDDAYYAPFLEATAGEDYDALYDYLISVRAANDVEWVYLCVLDPETKAGIYVIDADETETKCLPGTWQILLGDNKDAIFEDPSIGFPAYITHTEEYGWLCSAGAPIYNDDGEVIAFTFADILLNDIKNEQHTFLVTLLIILIAVTIVFSVLAIILVDHNAVRPVKKLTSATRAFVTDLSNEDTVKSGSSQIAHLDIKNRDEIGQLSKSVRFMEREIVDYIDSLAKVTAERERIGAELGVAKHIQASMLPCIFPAFPDRVEFDIYATMTPAKEVGGDFYDFFMVDKTHLAIVMADVSGKGVPAALFMVIGKTLIKDHTEPNEDLGEVFSVVNNLLCTSNSEGLFITAFEGVLDLVTGEFRFVNAGHEMPFISKAGGEFKPYKIKPGFVLAGMEDMKYKSGSIMIEPGDKIFQYTDGVTEATDKDNQLYGMERLEAVLTANSTKSPEEILKAVKADIDRFVGEAEQFDDITMLALEYREKMKETGEE